MRQLCLFAAPVLCLGLCLVFANGADTAPEGFRTVADNDAAALFGGETCYGNKWEVKLRNGGCGLQSKYLPNPDGTYTQYYCPQKDTFVQGPAGEKKVYAITPCYECMGTPCGVYIKECNIIPCDSPPEYDPECEDE